MSEPFDLIVENGTVVDGSGAEAFAAAVGVKDGRLSLVFGKTEEATPAARRIDATGMVVSPGFIDLHSHSGLMIFADPLHEPKVRQGVTTEVIGVDGLSYAPIPDPNDLEALAHMNAGLDGRPDNLAYDWGSVETYLDRLDALHPSVNLAFLVGNSALRMSAIGWDEVEATDAARSRTCARCCARRWRRAPSVSRRAWTIRPGPTPAPTSWRSSPARRQPTAASITRTCATRSAIGTWTRSGRRSRSAGAARARRTSPTSITGRPSPAGRDRCWRLSTTPAPRASTSPSTPTRTSGRAPDC